MRNLWLLIKNNFNLLLGRLQGKKQRKSTPAATALFVAGVVGLIALYSYQAWIMFDGLGAASLGKICMFHACTTSVSVLAILAIMRAAATEKTSDNDFLLSMPIKKRDIILSKLLNKYVFDYFFVALLALPYIIIYQIRCVFDLQVLIMGIILTLIMPLFSIGVSHTLDYIFSRLFNKSRFSKFLKSMATTIVFTIIMVILTITTSSYGSMIGVTNLDNYFAQRPISNLLLKFMFTPNFSTVLIVCLLAFVPFIVGFTLYLLALGKPAITYKSKSKTLKFKASRSPYSLLLKNEFYRYITTPAYLINTIIGVVIMVVFGVFAAFAGADGITSLFGGQIPSMLLAGIFALILCFSSSTVIISAPSVSLEGRSIWFLKAQPVSARTIISAKAGLHILITEPAIIISSVLASIFLKFTILEFLIVFLLPTIHMLIMCFMGLLLNLWVPNFDWENETTVVKQSFPSFMSMILGMLLTGGIVGLFFLFKHLELWLIFTLITSIYAVVATILIILTYTLGKTLFERI
jgi:ABC-2 type transport system permease protein